MVEFMERYVNNVFKMVNTPQGRLRRQELCQLLKMLLGKAGSDPDKSMEQWMDQGVPVEEQSNEEPPVEEPSIQIQILEQITDNDEQNDIYVASSSRVKLPHHQFKGEGNGIQDPHSLAY
ncbi:uncharacterized protein LOC123722610 [Papilio machaon]|uniref:uncharacterized protein LOC123721714 n=1 Tax=Papilio machaon TaxID=76193 RepID=UPI001E6645FB|nr:uncharacterized protein LOC123721714 [Papilio machaon]XP_045540664.1 uncharacterized protein LOC123722561 [Papilio machaon]XP_045540882.1 uncharacterized protein LOC123722610 [Papilio machaon]